MSSISIGQFSSTCTNLFWMSIGLNIDDTIVNIRKLFIAVLWLPIKRTVDPLCSRSRNVRGKV